MGHAGTPSEHHFMSYCVTSCTATHQLTAAAAGEHEQEVMFMHCTCSSNSLGSFPPSYCTMNPPHSPLVPRLDLLGRLGPLGLLQELRQVLGHCVWEALDRLQRIQIEKRERKGTHDCRHFFLILKEGRTVRGWEFCLSWPWSWPKL